MILTDIMSPTAFFAASAFGVRGLCPLTGRLSKVEQTPANEGYVILAGIMFPTAFFSFSSISLFPFSLHPQQPDDRIHQPFKTLFSWTRPQG